MQSILNRILDKVKDLDGDFRTAVGDNGFESYLVKKVEGKNDLVDLVKLGRGDTYEEMLKSTEKTIDLLIQRKYNKDIIISNIKI